MTSMPINLDEKRVEALRAAVSAGGAGSVQEAIESALDAWLTDQTLSHVSDEALQKLWDEGLASGDAGPLDLAALKAQARGSRA